MKSKLKLNMLEFTRPNKPKELSVGNVANQLWNKYSDDLSTTGAGNRISKEGFEEYLRAYYNENIDRGLSKKDAIKKAIKSYEMSNRYISPEERLKSFTLKDYFGDNIENRQKFQNLTRQNGRFTKFNPLDVKYLESGYIIQDGKKRHYVIERYQNLAIVTWQSPEEKEIIPFEELDAYFELLEDY